MKTFIVFALLFVFGIIFLALVLGPILFPMTNEVIEINDYRNTDCQAKYNSPLAGYMNCKAWCCSKRENGCYAPCPKIDQ